MCSCNKDFSFFFRYSKITMYTRCYAINIFVKHKMFIVFVLFVYNKCYFTVSSVLNFLSQRQTLLRSTTKLQFNDITS